MYLFVCLFVCLCVCVFVTVGARVFVYVCVCVSFSCYEVAGTQPSGASGERNIWRARDRKRDARDGSMARALNNADLFPERPDKTN